MCACLEVWSGVCPASNLCFGFFNFSPIWGGQVGHCLLHDLQNLCQKGICTVDRSKYVYEEATMATVWCSPGPSTGGIVFTFIYLFSTNRPSFKCIQMEMQKKYGGVAVDVFTQYGNYAGNSIFTCDILYMIYTICI